MGNKKGKGMGNDKLIINPRQGIGETRLPDMTPEEKRELEGTIISTPDGKDFELKEVVHKDLGDGDKVTNIEAVRVKTNSTFHLGDGVEVDYDFNESVYLEAMYDQYFDAFQNYNTLLEQKIQGKFDGKLYDEHSCFEDFCQDALARIEENRKEYKIKLNVGHMTNRVYGNACEVLDMAESTLRKFLEGSIDF